MTRAQVEYLVLLGGAICFLSFLIPSLRAQRALARDDGRQQIIAYLRRELEDYNNKHNYYPLTFTTPAGFEYVTTQTSGQQAVGYYLQTALEYSPSGNGGFDEDEARKYFYLIVQDHGRILYRVCGGLENQCAR